MSSTLSTFAKSQMAAEERESELKNTRRGLEERMTSLESDKVRGGQLLLLLSAGRGNAAGTAILAAHDECPRRLCGALPPVEYTSISIPLPSSIFCSVLFVQQRKQECWCWRAVSVFVCGMYLAVR